MPDDTTNTPVAAPVVDKPGQDSTIFGVSVRAWIVIMLVTTLCAVTIMEPILGYFISGDILIEIKEPFYSAVGISIGYYFGQSSKKQS